ncbi:protein of unknown function [Burkholderia multivorans]
MATKIKYQALQFFAIQLRIPRNQVRHIDTGFICNGRDYWQDLIAEIDLGTIRQNVTITQAMFRNMRCQAKSHFVTCSLTRIIT